MSKKKTNKEFVNEIQSINPSIMPLTVYKDSHSKVLFRCAICGKEWEAYPYQELNRHGLGCAKCSYKSAGANRRKVNSVFTDELEKKNPNVLLLTPYSRSKEKVKCFCKLCNNIWETTPDRLLRGIGCPNCYHSSTSFIEQFLYYALCFVLGENKVFSRDKKAIGKELDIYVPTLRLAIEYGSWYWHKTRVMHDLEKQKLCKENDIKFLLIYDNCDAESMYIHEDCYTFKYPLAMEKSYNTVKKIVISICESYNLDYAELENNWDSIVNLAYQKARKQTTADFIKLVKRKNSHNIEVLGEYKSSYDAILCRCRVCGYEWSPRPNNLINGNVGCPQCSGNKHYTNQDFVSKVSLVNPDFELLGQYTNRKTPILCRCRKCGYEWTASPGKLLIKRAGCPRCIGHMHYSNEEFVKKLKEINPSISPLESYPKNNKIKILCLCNTCGNRFTMRPNNLLSGQGCPRCSNERRILESVKDNDRFIEELRTINSNIITLEPYSNSKRKIACKCVKCGNEWGATPNSLLRGYGCPKCAIKRRSEQNKKRVLCIETETVYDSLEEASVQNGFSKSIISQCCNGKKKTAGGYHWIYIN